MNRPKPIRAHFLLRVFLAAGLLLASHPLPSRGAVDSVARYSLGDHDFGAPGRDFVVRNTRDISGTNTLRAQGAPRYSYEVSPTAALASATRLAVAFNGSPPSPQFLKGDRVSQAVDNFGIEAWVRPNTDQGVQIIAYNGHTGLGGWGLIQDGPKFRALFGGVAILGTRNNVSPGLWTHLALVRQDGRSTLYINGTHVDLGTATPNVPLNGGFAIGAPGQSSAQENFNGLIDDVRVFTFAPGSFTPADLLYFERHPTAEIRPLNDLNPTGVTLRGTVIPQGQPTVAWFEWGAGYNFDQATPPVAVSGDFAISSVAAPIGPLTSSVNYHYRLVATNQAGRGESVNSGWTTPPTNGFGASLELNGVSQYGQLTPGIYFDRDFTVETWVYLRTHEGIMPLLDFANEFGADRVTIDVNFSEISGPTLSIANETEASDLLVRDPLPLHQWIHLAFTLAGQTGKIYVNGSLEAANDEMAIPSAVVRNFNWIGASDDGPYYLADAQFDEIRIWNIARSEAELRATMRQVLAGNEPGLITYFRCDDAPGGTMADLADADGVTPAALFNLPYLAPGLTLPPAVSKPSAGSEGFEIAAFSALVNPGGLPTSAWFEWGTTTNYGQVTPRSSAGDGAADLRVNSPFLTVASNTIYHFRAVASNSLGVALSADRAYATTLTVRTNADRGPGSLREAVDVADLITFAPELRGTTIHLDSGELVVDRGIVIEGPGARALTLNGQRGSRLFRITGYGVTLSGLTLADGRSRSEPGAPEIDRCGGAILSTSSNLRVSNCHFTGNTAALRGGAVFIASDDPDNQSLLEACSFSGNHVDAPGSGHALAIGPFGSPAPDATRVLVHRCTFADNPSAAPAPNPGVLGGAIALAGSYLQIADSTVTRNSAGFGGGFYLETGRTELRNSIIADNRAASSGPDTERRDGAGSLLVSLGHNLIGDATGGNQYAFFSSNNADLFGAFGAPLDPRLGPLADNGGETLTCALLPGSPAIDAGYDRAYRQDQRGVGRPVGPRPDIGAFEVTRPWPLPIRLSAPESLPNGAFRLSFTNLAGGTFVVESTSHLIPPVTWSDLGRTTEIAPGRHTFTDAQPGLPHRRFYRVRPIAP